MAVSRKRSDLSPNKEKAVEISTVAARGGVISWRVITVLLVSLFLGIVCVGGIYLYFRTTLSSGM
jgi:hypothetical protein